MRNLPQNHLSNSFGIKQRYFLDRSTMSRPTVKIYATRSLLTGRPRNKKRRSVKQNSAWIAVRLRTVRFSRKHAKKKKRHEKTPQYRNALRNACAPCPQTCTRNRAFLKRNGNAGESVEKAAAKKFAVVSPGKGPDLDYRRP
jgi:hypothetical protein